MKFKLILLLCITESAIAQYGVGISYSFLNSSPITNASLYNPKADPGYLISLKTSYRVNNKISFEFGVSYSKQTIVWGENIPNTFVDGFYQNFYTNGNNLALTGSVRWTESYSAINLPIIFHYQFLLTKNSSILVGGGIHIGYLFERLNEVRYNTRWIDSRRNNNGEIIGGTNINLCYQYLFSEHLGFSLNADYLFEIYPKEGKRDLTFKSFGLGAGFIVFFPTLSVE